MTPRAGSFYVYRVFAMRCPFCNCHDTQVKDSRPSEDNTAIRRRRICADCGGRFTTFERIQLREIMVVKKNGRKMPFLRDKLERSVRIALRKRDVDEERIARMISGIVRQIEASGESEIRVQDIGAFAMEGLKRLDDVAYIRFASVYQDFTHTADFQTILQELAKAGHQGE